jgi:hypothetical protein
MTSKFKLFQMVIALRDLVEPDLTGAWGIGKPASLNGQPAVLKGTHGAVVEILEPGGLAVEFFDNEGETIDVAFIPEEYVRLATVPEIADYRGTFAKGES